MKIIIFNFFIFFSIKAASNCEELKNHHIDVITKTEPLSNITDLMKKRSAIFNEALAHLKKIIEMKFASANFIENNKDLYGRYVSLVESRKELGEKLEFLLKSRNKASTDYIYAINDISLNLPYHMLLQARDNITMVKNNENSILDQSIRHTLSRLNEMVAEYYIALEHWAPYRDNLKNLSDTEASLVRSLDKLSKIEGHINFNFNKAFILIQQTALVSEDLNLSEDKCKVILVELEKVLKLSKDKL